MDAEEIANMVRELKINREKGGEEVVITKAEEKRGNERLEKTVVGRIFARRMTNKETVRTHLPRILRARGGMEIDMMGHNIFAIEFALVSDKKVALEEGPWHFFQDLMILKETKPMQTMVEVDFNEITLWIQCNNVPMACMDAGIIRRIGEKIGKVEEIDMAEGGIRLGGKIRIRVTRRLDAPLIRYVPVKTEDMAQEAIVIIQYEKLPHFCFICGRIGHIQKDCEDEEAKEASTRYDHRMRVNQNSNIQQQRSWGRGQSGGEGGWREKGFNGREKVLGLGDRGRDGEEIRGGLVTTKEGGAEEQRDESEGETTGMVGLERDVGLLERERGGIHSAQRTRMDYVDQGGDKIVSIGGGEGGRKSGDAVMGLISPKKVRKKGVGKTWKKRAREKSSGCERGNAKGTEEGMFKIGSKRGGVEVEDEDQTPHK